MSERLSYPDSFPGGSASSLTPPAPSAQPRAAASPIAGSTPVPEVQLPGEMTLPQILEGNGGTGTTPSPQNLQPQELTPQVSTERAAYQARPRRVIEKTMTSQGKVKKLRISNLRNRMLIHTELISALALTVVGFILLISGMFQITYAERTQTQTITADLRNFTAVENAKSSGGLVSAKDAVVKFINAADAPYNGSLLGFSGGQLAAQKGCLLYTSDAADE